MKVNWGVLLLLAVGGVGVYYLPSYRGPHPEYFVIGYVALFFSVLSWGSLRTVALKRRLQKDGLAGTARLVRADTTGVTINDVQQFKLTLAVTGQNGETWEASVRQGIPQTQLYALAPGTVFPVLYDPSDKSKVVLNSQSQATGTLEPSVASVFATASAFTQKDPSASGDPAATAQAYREMAAKQDAVQKRLLPTGVLAPATVVTCAPLHATMNHRDPLVMLMLEVQPERSPVFMSQMSVCLDVTRLDRFAPGCIVYVRYDPADTSEVALVGSEKPN